VSAAFIAPRRDVRDMHTRARPEPTVGDPA
jgi:hypothetical protein